MNKTNLDYSEDLGDLAEQLKQVDHATQRLSKLHEQQNKSNNEDGRPAAHRQTVQARQKTTMQMPVDDQSKPRPPRRTTATQRDNRQPGLSPENDPWVSASFKVRNSKKLRLHELSLKRQLAGLAPYEKQHLIDKAIDYVLREYGYGNRESSS